MQHKTIYFSDRSGVVSLFSVLMVGIFALGTAFTVASGTIKGSRNNAYTLAGAHSFYTAESAMREGFHQYKHSAIPPSNGNYVDLNNTTLSEYDVREHWPIIEIAGEAENAHAYRSVLSTITVFPEGMAFEYATYAKKDLDVGGSATIEGNIFANGDIDFIGSHARIDGDAYSAQSIKDHANVQGSVMENVDPIPPPLIDITPYRSEADASNTLFVDPDDAESHLNNQHRTGVVFVETGGLTEISGTNTHLDGSIVTTGDLRINGGTITAQTNHAAIIVRGDLSISGGATINGVIHVTGDTTFGAGNNVVNGTLISIGDVHATKISGNSTIRYDPMLRGFWQNILGLDRESREGSRLLHWEER